MLTIRNLTKRTVIFNLPHAFACSDTVCTCSRAKGGVQEHDPITGERKVRAVNHRLAASITLMPKGMTGPGPIGPDGKPGPVVRLDEASGLLVNVARVPDVKAAKARGEIELSISAAKEVDAPPKEDATKATKKAAGAAVKE